MFQIIWTIEFHFKFYIFVFSIRGAPKTFPLSNLVFCPNKWNTQYITEGQYLINLWGYRTPPFLLSQLFSTKKMIYFKNSLKCKMSIILFMWVSQHPGRGGQASWDKILTLTKEVFGAPLINGARMLQFEKCTGQSSTVKCKLCSLFEF